MSGAPTIETAAPTTAQPGSCPRCAQARRSNRLGSEWCCWELVQLEALMKRETPPGMAELRRIHFIGRSANSIDRACRRYGLKSPTRKTGAKRRVRCAGRCGALLQPGGALVCDACTTALAGLEQRRAA